jgi:CBS domain-containing protein
MTQSYYATRRALSAGAVEALKLAGVLSPRMDCRRRLGGGSMTTVRDVMSADLVTVEPSTMMIEAVRSMSKARVGSVLVLEDGALVGIFTERDVLRAFDQMHADPARVSPMSKGMTWDPLTIGPNATVGEAMDRMLDGGFRHLPVMEGGTLVGIVSMRDLARSISKG